MENKELFKDKRWNQYLGGKVIGKSEITKEQKEWAENLHKENIKNKKK